MEYLDNVLDRLGVYDIVGVWGTGTIIMTISLFLHSESSERKEQTLLYDD